MARDDRAMEHGHASDMQHSLSSLAVLMEDDEAEIDNCLQTALSCWRHH